jgi:adenosylcobinamide-GDP ribazoletransferase
VLPAGDAGAPTAAAAAWLPLVGIIVGAVSGGAAQVAARISHPLAVAVAFALLVVLTGAVHVDGFLDACDALFAQVPVARRLEILKDPRHGSFAIAGFAVVAVMWIAALATLDAASYVAALAIAAGAARWGAVVHMLYAPHARVPTPSPAFERRPSRAVLLFSLALLAAVVFTATPRLQACVEALVAIVAATLALAWARKQLGGSVVGDCYGFAIVVGEVCALATAAVLSRT